MKDDILSRVPKDLFRLIYSYLYVVVVDDIKNGVQTCIVRKKRQNHNGGMIFLDVSNYDSEIVESPKCKIHKYNKNKTLNWERGCDSVGFLTKSSRMNICKKLLLSQDMEKTWNPIFGSRSRISVINGVVYNLVPNRSLDYAKVRLVPMFESDHCWQDLALAFMRIRDDESSKDVSKMERFEGMAIQRRSKGNSNSSSCGIM